MASSSSSSYFLLLCLSMFLAISSATKAMPYDYNGYADDEPDYYDYPQSPAPESADGSYYYDDSYDYDYPPSSPAPESGIVSYYDDASDYDDYPQSPAPESGDGGDYGYEYDNSLAPDYCSEVVRLISTCQDYLNEHKNSPSSECCKSLDDVAFISVDVGFKNMCDCMKDLQASFLQRRAENEIFQKCRYKYGFLPISRRECSMY